MESRSACRVLSNSSASPDRAASHAKIGIYPLKKSRLKPKTGVFQRPKQPGIPAGGNFVPKLCRCGNFLPTPCRPAKVSVDISSQTIN
jgi:hypothetical protein